MREGFYPALGTPLDEMGNVIESSLTLHVEDQIRGKASGLLVMGSMGIEAQVRQSQYVKIASIAIKAAKDTVPVMVGVMDNSIGRVLDRIESLNGLHVSGVVATTPFYFGMNQAEVKTFFEQMADKSPYPVYLYDLPGVTKTKITVDTAMQLMAHRNIAGIKTGDLPTARMLERQKGEVDPQFSILFSGLDVFDTAYSFGLNRQLDGMFSCTTPLNIQMYDHLANHDMAAASKTLDDIVNLRDLFVSVGVFGGFTHAMNLLGFEGNFAPDYTIALNAEQQEKVKAFMQQLKLI
ncbi:dihydrodipicolinate synthase family protein [Paenibacillus chungangensis]|uniref:Dihydrodipicolinate synthase family protein n=1 Tax=Paenibacillus chungangensis TaxID=696535 RepID=A0ABW3HUJ8_9BACL